MYAQCTERANPLPAAPACGAGAAGGRLTCREILTSAPPPLQPGPEACKYLFLLKARVAKASVCSVCAAPGMVTGGCFPAFTSTAGEEELQ